MTTTIATYYLLALSLAVVLAYIRGHNDGVRLAQRLFDEAFPWLKSGPK